MTTLLGLAGSLRANSHNSRVLMEIARRLPQGATLEVDFDIKQIPLFSEDDENPPPPGVQALWARIAASDGLVFSTPEYNQSIPGVVKNLVDWISRSPMDLLMDKPCWVVGATVGSWGTRIAQQQLRTVLTTCGARLPAAPAVFVRGAADGSDLPDLAPFSVAVAGFFEAGAPSSD